MRVVTRHNAFTLLELIVALAIIAVLIGLILSAVQVAREAANRTASLNNLRQIALGLQHYAEAHEQRVPGVHSLTAPPSESDDAILYGLLPFIDNQGGVIPAASGSDVPPSQAFRKVFMSPGDPTLSSAQPWDGPTSYVANIRAYVGKPSLAGGFPDGTSTTLAFCERYFCSWHPAQMGEFQTINPLAGVRFAYFETTIGVKHGTWSIGGPRRPSVADDTFLGDVLPVTLGQPPQTLPSVPGMTFQVRPRPLDASSTMPQTPFRDGLPVAMFDGSVRIIGPGIAPNVFWDLFTPNGGEVLGEF